jgi:3-dehydroquinate dehydratase-2
MKFLILNGPNLNMLGLREPEIYGRQTYGDLQAYLALAAHELDVEIIVYQSNHEGDLVDRIQTAYGQVDGIVINAAAYTHTSVAILDALKAVNIPAVEVHLTDVNAREEFRKVSYLRAACLTAFAGHGFAGYRMAMEYLKEHLA